MAGPDKAANIELDEFAFEIFKQAVARSPINRGGEQQARSAYVKAEAFLNVRDRIRSGELKPAKVDGPVLADCSVPNKHRTDPINMVSTRFGNANLELVNRVKKWLDVNPTPESDPLDIVPRFKSQYPELHWGDTPEQVVASIATARVIFTAYAKA